MTRDPGHTFENFIIEPSPTSLLELVRVSPGKAKRTHALDSFSVPEETTPGVQPREPGQELSPPDESSPLLFSF